MPIKKEVTVKSTKPKKETKKEKEAKPLKGFTFVTKGDKVYQVPKVRVQAKMIDDKAYCPVCGLRNFRVEEVDVVDIPYKLLSRAKCSECGCKIEYLWSTIIVRKEDKINEPVIVSKESEDLKVIPEKATKAKKKKKEK